MSGQNYLMFNIEVKGDRSGLQYILKKNSHICIVALVRGMVWFSLEPSGVFGSTNPVVYTKSSVL